ncbi:MAG TPA: SufD family Fe-S cluster assembly protein [Thermoplasmata archaeon]|nr:SufD family Fe-S cluster assembly protein [Thermoplasmata archaeon]
MATAIARPAEWVTPAHVTDLSRSLGEPEASRERRLAAYERFLELPIEPNPLYRGYGYFTNVDLSGLDAVSRGAAVGVPKPPEGTVRIVHDAQGTRASVPPALRDAGVSVVTLSAEEEGRLRAPGSRFSDSEEPSDRLSALSVALLNRGYLLEVPDRLRAAVHVQDITVLSRPHEALSVRRVVRAGENAQLLLTEEVYSDPATSGAQRLYASAVDVDLGANAKAVYLTMHAPDSRAVSIYQRAATTGRASRLAWLWLGLGGFRSKARNRTRLVGQGSVVDDLQLFYGAGEQSYDSSVHLTHEGTDTHGQSITRGVFTDRARGMSRGLVRIEKDATKTLSFISEHAMLLSRGARSDTIPILEILCRDVKATHSTSVHPVDPEQVFYLESRGIREADAIRMIGEGFLSYVLDRAPITSLRDLVYPALEARWNGEELAWAADGSRALPELQVTGTEGAPEWRFDAKLR